MSAYVFRRLMLQHVLLWGNGLAEIERGRDGRVLNLWPLPPDRTRLERDASGELLYRVSTEQQGDWLLPRNSILHLSDGSFDGLWGQSRIALARRSVGAGIAADAFAASYYANGAAIGGVIVNKGRQLTPEARQVLLEEFNAKYTGPDRAHKTLYLDGGMEYEHGAMPLKDAEFVSTRRFQVEEIARWYGVPPHLLQDLSEANYAVSYEASKNFVEHTLRPLCVLMEQEANLRLFGYRAQGAVYSRINLAGLMRADPRTRGEYYRSLINAGVMSINEVRELEEMNSIGEAGDEHYLQSNMSTLAKIAAFGGQQPQPEPEEEEQDDQEQDEPNEPENVIRRDALNWWRGGGREIANG
jgi:HK97 family phage portal protein